MSRNTYSRTSPPSQADVFSFYDKLSNWGRWGQDDQLGTLNLIDAPARKRGAAAVRHGVSVSCSFEVQVDPERLERHFEVRPVNAEDTGPKPPYPPTYFADVHQGSMSERLGFAVHDMRFTHLDALCHQFWDGKMYNGRSADSAVDRTEGATFGAISTAADVMVTRAVLFDIPGLRGVKWLDEGEAVFPEDLEEAEERYGVRVEPGDAVLLRTGIDRRRHETGEFPWPPVAGWHAACLPWFRDRDVAFIGSDGGNDVFPSGYPEIFAPVHTCGLVAMGLWLIDHCDLDACARTAERLGQWDFLLAVCPIRFPGASGSPVNPVATF